MRYELGTKAETLDRIYGKLTCAEILPQFTFTVREWEEDRRAVTDKYRKSGWEEVIVRSSALDEDTSTSSGAGRYESVGGIRQQEEFVRAVDQVAASYDGRDGRDQVLVQPMLKDVRICGVAFTLDPNTLGNYYVINYDETGSTTSVTSGNGRKDKLFYVFKKKAGLHTRKEGIWGALLYTLWELEGLFGQDHLDVEFAVTQEDELYIFQVRALVVSGEPADHGRQADALKGIEKKIREAQSRKPFLCGRKTIYGVMPDWNPAEMIGIRPKPLALSLYRELITDSVWAYQRDNYGYRNMRSFPLMVDFCGSPYIDVRVSFNSFIPARLDGAISEKLVDHYVDRLAEDPSKHDKVEFDIVFSCYTLDLPERIQILKEYGFTGAEVEQIVDALRDVTNGIIDPETGLWRQDLEKIKLLERRYDTIMSSSMGEIEKIYWLLEDCKRYGTLPFAGLARAAFIAVQILQSLVNVHIFSQTDYQDFINDVSTVSSVMSSDLHDLCKEGFLERYGHLRPGTYDINSPRYDEAPDLYFDSARAFDGQAGKKKAHKNRFKLSVSQLHALKKILDENRLNDDILGLLDFIRSVIEGREYGKFIFTKNVSKAIQLIGEVGQRYGFSKDDCSYISVKCIYGLYSSSRDVRQCLSASITEGKQEYAVTRSITLPPLILDAQDVWEFQYPDAEPNYITSKSVRGHLVEMRDGISDAGHEDKILLIESADPGYDWIFAKGIRGFITKYGGANSHMAIRAGELGLPAVIGIGTLQYEKLKDADMVEIDALNKKIRVLR